MIPRFGVPIELDRDEARELARQELSQPGYERDVSWPARVLEWLLEQFARLIDGAAEVIPGGLGVLLLLAVLIVVAVIAVVRTGPLARRRTAQKQPVFREHRRTAAEHRAAADDAAREGDWATAVVERFRAVVTHLEERGVIEARSGRTADEVATLAGGRLPEHQDDLRSGAALFNRVLYGGHTPDADDDAHLRALDAAVQRARPKAADGREPILAVPR